MYVFIDCCGEVSDLLLSVFAFSNDSLASYKIIKLCPRRAEKLHAVINLAVKVKDQGQMSPNLIISIGFTVILSRCVNYPSAAYSRSVLRYTHASSFAERSWRANDEDKELSR